MLSGFSSPLAQRPPPVQMVFHRECFVATAFLTKKGTFMLVPQSLKDWIEVGDGIGVAIGLLGAAGAVIRWWLRREQIQEEGKKAITQINKMATNDLPHLFEESLKTNKHLEDQTNLLTNIDKGITILVDRGAKGRKRG